MTEYAYHCSPNGDIKEFIPQVSSHGKAYVYATPNKSLSLVFGAPKHGDYIIHPVYNKKDNSCTFVEMQPDALAKYYRGKSAYLYTVNKDDFTETTGWAGEICSSKEVKPLKVEFIEDLEQAILEEQKKGHLQIISYDRRNDNGYNMDELFASRDIAYVIRKNDEIYEKKYIQYLKKLENKEVFSFFNKRLNLYIESFKDKENIADLNGKTIFTPDYISMFKNDSSDRTINSVFTYLARVPSEYIKQAIGEIKATNNKELLQKIIFSLTKLNNMVKEIETKTPIVQPKTME